MRPDPTHKMPLEKCFDQSKKIAHRIWILGKKRRNRLLKNRNNTRPICCASEENQIFRSNEINTSGTLLNVTIDAEAKLKHGIAA